VGRAGIGLDNVDVAKATELGIMVVNARCRTSSRRPNRHGVVARPGSQHPPSALGAEERQVGAQQVGGRRLHGKTLGVIGLGKIGALVAQRAMAFGMRIVAYDPYISEQRARHMGIELVDLDTLLAQSDFITIHLPRTRRPPTS